MVVSKWSDAEAAKCNGDLLALRVYTSRIIGADQDLVLHGGGNTSVKMPFTDIIGNEIPALYVKGSGWDLATIEKEGFSPVRMDYMLNVPKLPSLTDTELVQVQKQALLSPTAPAPSIESMVHAMIPFTFVDHTHADAVCLLTNTSKGRAYCEEVYGDKAIIVDYCIPGFILAHKLAKILEGADWSKYNTIVLLNHGIFSWGHDAKTSYESMINLVNKAEDFMKAKGAFFEKKEAPAGHLQCAFCSVSLANLRKNVCVAAGVPQIMKFNLGFEAQAYASRDDLENVSQIGTLTPDHIIQTKRTPAIVNELSSESIASDVGKFVTDYKDYYERNKTPEHKMLDPAPRWILLKGKGWATAGNGVKNTIINDDIACHTARAIQWAQKLDTYAALSEKDLFDVEYWELEQAKLRKGGARKDFDGKIVCVSGAASGIGKACAKAFLDDGACVLGLDINEQVTSVFKSPAYMGVAVDLCNTDAVVAALQQCVHTYGGIDVLVLNAGIVPKSANIADLDPQVWDRSMNINLTASQRLMTAAIPYLKLGCHPAIIIVGTKNAPAPGKSMAAYSCAKAALTQLGRIAALELAADGVRVNTVHPDAVFDTGIWTQEVLETRAKAYGLTVDQYKRRNLMKAEITSHDVAGVVKALAGRAFLTVTGAQVPVNGGDERTI